MACNRDGVLACVPADARLAYVLAGGDDYELVFTAPPHARPAVRCAAASSATPVTRIGQVQDAPGLRLVDAQGALMENRYRSFDHFAR